MVNGLVDTSWLLADRYEVSLRDDRTGVDNLYFMDLSSVQGPRQAAMGTYIRAVVKGGAADRVGCTNYNIKSEC